MSDVDLVGGELGDYHVQRIIGRGGMGVVYLAEDLALRRPVALKVLAPRLLNDSDARRRFQREIERSAQLEHPNIVPVYAAGYEKGRLFISMRFIDGPDLFAVKEKAGRLPEDRALRLFGQVASALEFVHDRGLVHRDVKPQNVLVWGAGRPDEHAFLTDFGITKAINETSGMTGMGILGTPAYMAPELWLGDMITSAADQYALACLLFELLTGAGPYGDTGDLREQHLGAPLPQLSGTHTTTTTVGQAIDRALAKTPHDRFPTVRAFAEAAGRPSSEAFRDSTEAATVLAASDSATQRVTQLVRRAGYSESLAEEVATMSRDEIVRLRRKATRRALMGE